MLILLSLLWGGSFFFMKLSLAELPTFTIVFSRVGLAAITLLIYLKFSGKALPSGMNVWLAFFIMGFLNNLVPFCLLVWGMTEIASGLAAITLTRQRYRSHSGLQESARSRRGLQPMVAPLVKVATPSWRFLEAPKRLKIDKKGHRVPAHGRRYQNLLENDYSGVLMPCRELAHDG